MEEIFFVGGMYILWKAFLAWKALFVWKAGFLSRDSIMLYVSGLLKFVFFNWKVYVL